MNTSNSSLPNWTPVYNCLCFWDSLHLYVYGVNMQLHISFQLRQKMATVRVLTPQKSATTTYQGLSYTVDCLFLSLSDGEKVNNAD